jgi:glycosyltransferase involved in cell wall biosynthesis
MEHITVCICTYKRPKLLERLLEDLAKQETGGTFEFSISVVDNDSDLSAKPVIEGFMNGHRVELRYAHSSDRNLAHLRNLSLTNASGEYVAFIDDDEHPIEKWLLFLYQALHEYQVDGVLGPVLPDYQVPPPPWVVKGKLCERPRLKTGSPLNWHQTRTGNALLRRSLFMEPDSLFDLKYKLGAEDDALFRRFMSKGHRFVWCDEAVVYEETPADRLTAAYFLKRSRLIGFMSYAYDRDTRTWLSNAFMVVKSLLAFVIYLVLMPFFLAGGYHHFIQLLIRFHYHKAVILTSLGALNLEIRDLS